MKRRNRFKIVPLSEGNLPSDFDCGDVELNGFILDDAYSHMVANVARTKVVLHEKKHVAFYSLSADKIKPQVEERQRVMEIYGECIRYPHFPALLIGRLAVDAAYQGLGLGTYMLYDILGAAQVMQEKIGLRYITVDSYKASMGFYERHGFVPNKLSQLDDPNETTISMRLEISPDEPIENNEDAEPGG